MAFGKRGLAITLLFMILITFFTNVLGTNQSVHASAKFIYICDAHHRGHFFTKKTGYLSLSSMPLWGSLNVSEGTPYGNCREMCIKLCSCTGYFLQIGFDVEIANKARCVLFERSVPYIVEDSSSLDHFYIFTRNRSIVPPPTQTPAAAPPSSDKSRITSRKGLQWWVWVLYAAPPATAISVVALFCYLGTRRARSSQGIDELNDEEFCKGNMKITLGTIHSNTTKKLGDELLYFRFKCIYDATNRFSYANKLGEGGFGPVYKGNLVDGQEVAVKRLCRSSSQGMVEFKNEIKLIAKLQHTNLVRLLGCCTEGSERMLVYEFLPNKSLDSFLFDPSKKKLLDWTRRLQIIEGTSQALLYLHKYSRLKVIHRDLKTSNILLDSNLNPKISDFGLARIFEHNKFAANTRRIVGTYGYMSPEYAMQGLYSEKSDVFSFGVIVLEIMSGRKATSFSGIEHPLNLIRYAWDLFTEGKPLEFIDGTIGETSCSTDEELIRHIHVGLLCVEESAIQRPTMSEVVSMLTNYTVPLTPPKHPAFYCDETRNDLYATNCSPNLITMSPVEGR